MGSSIRPNIIPDTIINLKIEWVPNDVGLGKYHLITLDLAIELNGARNERRQTMNCLEFSKSAQYNYAANVFVWSTCSMRE